MMTEPSAGGVLKEATLRAGVKIAISIVVMFPMLYAVDIIRASFGNGIGLVALIVAVAVGFLVVANLAGRVLVKVSTYES